MLGALTQVITYVVPFLLVLTAIVIGFSIVPALLADEQDQSLESAAMELLPKLQGAFCFVFMNEDTLYAARDPQGLRPLVIGRLERGWVVASETAALDIVGASFVREVEPGEVGPVGVAVER